MVNDCAERAIALIKQYQHSVKDEQQIRENCAIKQDKVSTVLILEVMFEC